MQTSAADQVWINTGNGKGSSPWILLELWMMEVVVTTGAIRHLKLH